MKKLLLAFLVLVILFTAILPVNVFAASSTLIAQTTVFKYRLSEFDTIAITGGTGFNGMPFGALKDALAQQFPEKNIMDLDLPGHRDFTLLSNNEYTFNNYVKYITDKVEHMGKVLLVGHSLGASVLLEVATRDLSNIVGVVSISGSDRYTVLQDPVLRDLIWTEVQAVVSSIYGDVALPVAEKDFQIDIQLDIRNKLSRIRCPVLIIYGQNDAIAIPSDQQRMKNSLGRKATLVSVPNVGHELPLVVGELVADEIHEWTENVNIVKLYPHNLVV